MQCTRQWTDGPRQSGPRQLGGGRPARAAVGGSSAALDSTRWDEIPDQSAVNVCRVVMQCATRAAETGAAWGREMVGCRMHPARTEWRGRDRPCVTPQITFPGRDARRGDPRHHQAGSSASPFDSFICKEITLSEGRDARQGVEFLRWPGPVMSRSGGALLAGGALLGVASLVGYYYRVGARTITRSIAFQAMPGKRYTPKRASKGGCGRRRGGRWTLAKPLHPAHWISFPALVPLLPGRRPVWPPDGPAIAVPQRAP